MVCQEGDAVLLSTRNASQRTVQNTKFLPKYVGPFTVLRRVGDVAYRLQVPKGLRWHNVFHVSLLKPYRAPSRPDAPRATSSLLPPVIDGEVYYEVEKIVGHKIKSHQIKTGKSKDDPKRKGKPTYLYLVKWVGYPDSDNSWEPVSNFS